MTTEVDANPNPFIETEMTPETAVGGTMQLTPEVTAVGGTMQLIVWVNPNRRRYH